MVLLLECGKSDASELFRILRDLHTILHISYRTHTTYLILTSYDDYKVDDYSAVVPVVSAIGD